MISRGGRKDEIISSLFKVKFLVPCSLLFRAFVKPCIILKSKASNTSSIGQFLRHHANAYGCRGDKNCKKVVCNVNIWEWREKVEKSGCPQASPYKKPYNPNTKLILQISIKCVNEPHLHHPPEKWGHDDDFGEIKLMITVCRSSHLTSIVGALVSIPLVDRGASSMENVGNGIMQQCGFALASYSVHKSVDGTQNLPVGRTLVSEYILMATLGGICAAPRGRKHSDLVRVGILPPKSLLPSTLSPVIECPVWRRQCALQSPRHRFSSFKLQVACMETGHVGEASYVYYAYPASFLNPFPSDAHEAAKNSGRGEIDTAGAVSQIIAKQLTIDPSTVKPDSKLRELGVDSLDTSFSSPSCSGRVEADCFHRVVWCLNLGGNIMPMGYSCYSNWGLVEYSEGMDEHN
eukprot:Gb_35058 [translate_table: standard]